MKVYAGIVLALLTLAGSAQGQVYLWNKTNMPNSKGLKVADSIANERVYAVSKPLIEVYQVSKEENRGFAVMIIPGGGYAREAHVVSGSQLAKFVNSIGGTAFVLRYRLPVSPDLIQREKAPLQDGQRALQWIRSLAPVYGFERNKVGVWGTSAGGHLASLLGVTTEDITTVHDSIDKYSCRPDFMILLSPVITLADPYAHKGSRENLLGKNAAPALIDQYSTHLHVSSQTPPALLMHANDDKAVPSLNSVFFYTALREKGVNASLHIFPSGGHAINLTKSPGTTAMWPEIVNGWLKECGISQ